MRISDYFMNGDNGPQRLESINREKDLGLYISNNMKVENQCREAANKAKRALGPVNRTFKYHNPRSFTNL